MFTIFKALFFLIILITLFTTANLQATDFTSTSFIIRDPAITDGGSFGTSTSFDYLGSFGQWSGEGTSTNFTAQSGFIYTLLGEESSSSPPSPPLSPPSGGGGGGSGSGVSGGFVQKAVAKAVEFIKRIIPHYPLSGDLNVDGEINIYDVSILLSFWEKDLTKSQAKLRLASLIEAGYQLPDLNGDNKVDIRDFSMLLRRWTGYNNTI